MAIGQNVFHPFWITCFFFCFGGGGGGGIFSMVFVMPGIFERQPYIIRGWERVGGVAVYVGSQSVSWCLVV